MITEGIEQSNKPKIGKTFLFWDGYLWSGFFFGCKLSWEFYEKMILKQERIIAIVFRVRKNLPCSSQFVRYREYFLNFCPSLSIFFNIICKLVTPGNGEMFTTEDEIPFDTENINVKILNIRFGTNQGL